MISIDYFSGSDIPHNFSLHSFRPFTGPLDFPFGPKIGLNQYFWSKMAAEGQRFRSRIILIEFISSSDIPSDS